MSKQDHWLGRSIKHQRIKKLDDTWVDLIDRISKTSVPGQGLFECLRTVVYKTGITWPN